MRGAHGCHPRDAGAAQPRAPRRGGGPPPEPVSVCSSRLGPRARDGAVRPMRARGRRRARARAHTSPPTTHIYIYMSTYHDTRACGKDSSIARVRPHPPHPTGGRVMTMPAPPPARPGTGEFQERRAHPCPPSTMYTHGRHINRTGDPSGVRKSVECIRYAGPSGTCACGPPRSIDTARHGRAALHEGLY